MSIENQLRKSGLPSYPTLSPHLFHPISNFEEDQNDPGDNPEDEGQDDVWNTNWICSGADFVFQFNKYTKTVYP